MEMDLCLRLGIPPSQLEGWGDEADRALVFEHLANESLRCGGCGGYMDDTTDPTKGQMVHDEVVCNRCRALEIHREKLATDKSGQPTEGRKLWAESVQLDGEVKADG